MKNHSMFWNFVFWLCDCDKTETVMQMMKIMDIGGERKRRLERLLCEKSSPKHKGSS